MVRRKKFLTSTKLWGNLLTISIINLNVTVHAPGINAQIILLKYLTLKNIQKIHRIILKDRKLKISEPADLIWMCVEYLAWSFAYENAISPIGYREFLQWSKNKIVSLLLCVVYRCISAFQPNVCPDM